jgi:hypothetical protein
LVWQCEARPGPARLAAVLFGLNPVAVYFAGEMLDTTFALSLAMAGVYAALRAHQADSARSSTGWGLAAALGFGLATLARPHYAILVLAAPVLLAVTAPATRRRTAPACAAAGLAVLLAGAGIQSLHVGHFAILPWQGAYALWAANKPSSNGRYFAQEVTTFGAGEQRNPARLESEVLYARETGLPPDDIPAMNRHWRSRFWAHVRERPAEWIGLMARKAYYVANSHEQYNNKTFAFQRTLSPWLRWNPLHWGLTLVLAVLGGAVLWAHVERRRVAILVAGLAAAYALGTILYFPSDRFRLPILPLLCLLAGGVTRIGEARAWRPAARAGTAAAATLAAAVTYSGFFDARDESTVVMDKVLLASAASRTGDDGLAARTARELVGDGRVGTQATMIFLESYANLRMEPDWRATVAAYGDWSALDALWAGPAGADPSLGFNRAVHLWNRGSRQEASGLWRAIASNPSDPRATNALACLVLTGALEPGDGPLVNSYLTGDARRMTPLLYSALTSRISPERLTPSQAELVQMYERLLGLTSSEVRRGLPPTDR